MASSGEVWQTKIINYDPAEALTRGAEEDQLLADHDAAIGRIMADPDSASSYRDELSAWDGTLQDGL